MNPGDLGMNWHQLAAPASNFPPSVKPKFKITKKERYVSNVTGESDGIYDVVGPSGLGVDYYQMAAPTSNFLPPAKPKYKLTKKDTYIDNVRGISDGIQRKVKVSNDGYEFKESRKYTVDPVKVKKFKKIPGQDTQIQSRKKHATEKLKERPKPKASKSHAKTSQKVKMEIYLERFKTGVFVTKVKVGKRLRWQKVKYEKQPLRFHPAIKERQSVRNAIDTVKSHKTLHISVSEKESLRYKAGDLLEGVSRPKPQPQPEPNIMLQQQLNYYDTNNYVYNAGPSTASHCIEDNNDKSDSGSSFYSSDYSYSTDG